jgi:hypothetical protein
MDDQRQRIGTLAYVRSGLAYIPALGVLPQIEVGSGSKVGLVRKKVAAQSDVESGG